jgi:hypothetical protein
VTWGGIHGLALSAERALNRRPAPAGQVAAGPDGQAAVVTASRAGRLRAGVGWLVTFHVVCLAWILFRAETFALAWDFLVGLATAPLAGPVNAVAASLIGLSLFAQLAPDDLAARLRRLYARLDPAMQSAAVGAWIFLVAALGPEGVAPFIYFQF